MTWERPLPACSHPNLLMVSGYVVVRCLCKSIGLVLPGVWVTSLVKDGENHDGMIG